MLPDKLSIYNRLINNFGIIKNILVLCIVNYNLQNYINQ